jgi:small conductance mechanosensitive channel
VLYLDAPRSLIAAIAILVASCALQAQEAPPGGESGQPAQEMTPEEIEAEKARKAAELEQEAAEQVEAAQRELEAAQREGEFETVVAPDAPIRKLEYLLTPMTMAELEEEALLWRDLVKAKVEELSVLEYTSDSSELEPETRTKLLEDISEKQSERTALIVRLNAVLDELEDKGGDPEELRKYAASVATFNVDVTDANAVWVAVKGWLLSSEGGLRWAQRLGAFVGILIVGWIASRIVAGLVRQAVRRFKKASELLRDFLVTIAKQLTLLVAFVIALSQLGINIGPLLAAIGAAGFIIGFALQGTLSNFASGVMILLYRPFDVGDAVDVAGVSGKVESMTLVSTTMATWDNQQIIVPNNEIWGNVIKNITGKPIRRVDMVFGIGYADDIEKARSILDRLVKAHPKVLKDPEPNIRVHELADSSVNFICRPWSKTSDYWDVYWDLTRQVKEAFDDEGVSIPFPQRDVHIHQAQGASEVEAKNVGV